MWAKNWKSNRTLGSHSITLASLMVNVQLSYTNKTASIHKPVHFGSQQTEFWVLRSGLFLETWLKDQVFSGMFIFMFLIFQNDLDYQKNSCLGINMLYFQKIISTNLKLIFTSLRNPFEGLIWNIPTGSDLPTTGRTKPNRKFARLLTSCVSLYINHSLTKNEIGW